MKIMQLFINVSEKNIAKFILVSLLFQFIGKNNLIKTVS